LPGGVPSPVGFGACRSIDGRFPLSPLRGLGLGAGQGARGPLPGAASRRAARVDVEITIAGPSERPVLENLLNLYIHDFSEVLGRAPDPDGRFTYDRLPLYFEESGRTPFLVRCGSDLAGFALVSSGSLVSGSPDVWDLSEFFVVRGLRRRGVGRSAASHVFRRFLGVWEVRAMDRNEGASAFWANTIARHTNGGFEVHPWESEPGTTWKVFRFSQEQNPG